MSAFDLQEQEQLSELKAWWHQWGNLVTAIVVAVAVTIAAWSLWNRYQQNQGNEASTVFIALQKAVAENDAKGTREAAGEIINKYPSTIYASVGALLSAKVQAEAGDTKTAKTQLQWVVDKSSDAELRDLARLRLAGLLLDEKAGDEALKVLAADCLPAFAVRFDELRGDILASLGKTTDAASAYQKALGLIDKNSVTGNQQRVATQRDFIQMKLDSLGTK